MGEFQTFEVLCDDADAVAAVAKTPAAWRLVYEIDAALLAGITHSPMRAAMFASSESAIAVAESARCLGAIAEDQKLFADACGSSLLIDKVCASGNIGKLLASDANTETAASSPITVAAMAATANGMNALFGDPVALHAMSLSAECSAAAMKHVRSKKGLAAKAKAAVQSRSDLFTSVYRFSVKTSSVSYPSTTYKPKSNWLKVASAGADGNSTIDESESLSPTFIPGAVFISLADTKDIKSPSGLSVEFADCNGDSIATMQTQYIGSDSSTGREIFYDDLPMLGSFAVRLSQSSNSTYGWTTRNSSSFYFAIAKPKEQQL